MKLLRKLYSISSPSGYESKMQKFILSRLKQLGATYYTDASGNIYATKGISETYPCIVAHMDEVHASHSKGFALIRTDGLIFGYNKKNMEQTGIGADDKNGIWVCLKAMEKYDCMKCAFFVEEETGCKGSSKADMNFFADCRYVLQCDRKGNSDFITDAAGTELCDNYFIGAIDLKKFGYKETQGSVTDVMALKENGLNICAANISCGYYNPHTRQETTCIRDLHNCFNLVCWIVENCTEVYTHEYAGGYMATENETQIILEELYAEMKHRNSFEEEDLIDFYNDYAAYYDIPYETLYNAFLRIKEKKG